MLNNHLEELWLCFSNQMTSRHIPLLLSIILPTRANWSDHPTLRVFHLSLTWDEYIAKRRPPRAYMARGAAGTPFPSAPLPCTPVPLAFLRSSEAVPLQRLYLCYPWATTDESLCLYLPCHKNAHTCACMSTHTYTSLK